MKGGEKKMKKLFVLVIAILAAGLLVGCWVLPEIELVSIVVEPSEIYLGPGKIGTTDSVTACYKDWATEEITLTD